MYAGVIRDEERQQEKRRQREADLAYNRNRESELRERQSFGNQREI